MIWSEAGATPPATPFRVLGPIRRYGVNSTHTIPFFRRETPFSPYNLPMRTLRWIESLDQLIESVKEEQPSVDRHFRLEYLQHGEFGSLAGILNPDRGLWTKYLVGHAAAREQLGDVINWAPFAHRDAAFAYFFPPCNLRYRAPSEYFDFQRGGRDGEIDHRWRNDPKSFTA